MYFFIKRIADFFIAFIALIVLSPVLILITLFLFIANNGKPFFFQKRPGKDAKIFTIIKFKTMNDKKSKDGILLSDELRLTKIGKFVRSTSLDELPQLLNVVVGDMSIVGPRPLLPGYLTLYNDFQSKRHQVRPGITGWAQVNGRNAISWDDKFKLDVFYVQNITFVLDIRIIIKTLKKAFIREGINANDSCTTEAFKGNFK